MARISMLVALVVVVAAVAARHTELRQDEDKNCPKMAGVLNCVRPERYSCLSSEHCNKGDACCYINCGYHCYNKKKGFYGGTYDDPQFADQ